MDSASRETNRRILGAGAALATVGGACIVYTLIAHPSYVDGAAAFPIGFVMGLAAGAGAGLALFGLVRTS